MAVLPLFPNSQSLRLGGPPLPLFNYAWDIPWRLGWWPLSYSSGSSILVEGTHDALKVSYSVSGEPLSYEIQIVRGPVHFGGAREWLHCPSCRKRFDILYLARRMFLCRRCNGLAYQTQWEKRAGRQLIRAQRLWERAGLEFGGEGQKPKWKQWRTHNRLVERAEHAYMASWDTPFLRRLMAEAED